MVNAAQRKPTKKEMRTLVEAFDDLLFYSRAHLNQTDRDMRPTWGDLNAAIHRAEQVLNVSKK